VDVDQLTARNAEQTERLSPARAVIEAAFPYPSDILGNIAHLDGMLSARAATSTRWRRADLPCWS
jgi:hypothetical protein